MYKHLFYGLTMLMMLINSSLIAQPDITAIYGDSGNQIFNYVNYDEDSKTFFAVGSSKEIAAVSRIDQNGVLLWTKTYGEIGSSFESFVFTPVNNGVKHFVVAGITPDPTADSQDAIFYSRLDFNGDAVWPGGGRIRTLSPSNPGIIRPFRVKILASSPMIDDYMITATLDRPNNSLSLRDELVYIKIKGLTGNVLFDNTYSTPVPADNQVYDLISNNSGGVYFCGDARRGKTTAFYGQIFNNGGTGITTNNRFTFDNSNFSRFLTLTRTQDNGFVLAGSNLDDTDKGDGIIIKLDASGTPIWRRLIPDKIPITSVVEMDNGNIVAARVTSDSLQLITLDSTGSFILAQDYINVDAMLEPRLRLEHTGGPNDRLIAYTAVNNLSSGFGAHDPLLIVIDPSNTNLNCLATPAQITLNEPSLVIDRVNLRKYNLETEKFNEATNNTENWDDKSLCAESPQARLQHDANHQMGATLSNKDNQISIHLFPNPAKDKITLQIDQGSWSHLQIKDMNGRSMEFEVLDKGVNSASLNIASLPAGIYYLEIIDDAGKRAVKPLVIIQ